MVSAAELAQPGSYAYIIFDQKLREGLKATEKYISTGITVQGDTIEDLAAAIDVDPATLADTLANWNKYVADKNDPDFGRTTGMENDLSTPPYYAIKIAPGIHHTMGGVHGGNRLGGNAVADIVVFGRIASASAVDWCNGGAAGAAENTEVAEEAGAAEDAEVAEEAGAAEDAGAAEEAAGTAEEASTAEAASEAEDTSAAGDTGAASDVQP